MNQDRIEIAEQAKGWLLDGEGETLHRWALTSPGPLVEIGSYCGKSSVWIAAAAAEIGQPFVSVDWHRGNPEMRPGSDCHDPDVWDDFIGATDTIQHLRRTIHQAELEPQSALICATSEQVGSWWTTPVGFLFIDADHGAAAQDDYRRWNPHMMPDGVLCFHDTAIPAVKAATYMAEVDGWVEREVIGDCLRVFTRDEIGQESPT